MEGDDEPLTKFRNALQEQIDELRRDIQELKQRQQTFSEMIEDGKHH